MRVLKIGVTLVSILVLTFVVGFVTGLSGGTASPSQQAPVSDTASLHFSGNGVEQLPPIDVRRDSMIYWTDDGGWFALKDPSNPNLPNLGLLVWSRASSGSSSIRAGHYRLVVSAIGNWSFDIR